MRLSSKIKFDHTLGRVLCYGLFPLIRVLGFLLRRDHSIQESTVGCIVVAKYYGMGSIIHTTPMLRALKAQYPRARLVFVTRKNNRELFAHFSDIDELLLIDDGSLIPFFFSNIRLIFKLMRSHVDLFFDLELFSAYGALVSLFSLTRNRFGFLCGLETDFKTYLYTHLMYFNFQMPIRICYLQLARIAGIAENASTDLVKPLVGASLRNAMREKLAGILGRRESDKGLLAVNINASDLMLERRWPLDRFEVVVRHFARQGHPVLFVGSADERPYVQGLVDRLGELPALIYNVAGNFTLPEFFALLEECAALLTADTGIMNFAYALHVPTVSLWGPCSPIQYHVENETTRAIWKPVYCSPCVHRFLTPPCRGNNVCMALIEAGEVINSLEYLLAGHHKKQHEYSHPVHSDLSGIPLGLLRDHKKTDRGSDNTR
jgi:ADP-heptose:LPS heptosyltransferase